MFDLFIDKIKNRVPFSFVRYGDGEMSAIFGTRPETHGNVDGHLFYKDMGEELKKVILSRPPYYMGMQRFAREETHPKEIQAFIEGNKLEDIDWVNADVWHHASIKGYFEDFFQAVKQHRQIMLVAPEYLNTIFDKIRFEAETENNPIQFVHLRIPEKNCWLSKDAIIERVKERLKRQEWPLGSESNVLVLFCASMPTKIFINELYKEFGGQHSLLDTGSVFDPYVGKSSRSYHKKILERMNNEKK